LVPEDDASEKAEGKVGDTDRPPEPVMLDYAGITPGKLINIAHFPTDFEAGLASGLLYNRGVRFAAIRNADPWGRWSVDLQVAEPDEPTAVEILAGTPARKFLTVHPSRLPPTPALKPLACPSCGSTRIGPVSRKRRVLIPLILLAWLPWLGGVAAAIYIVLLLLWPALCLLDRPWSCAECGRKLPPGGEVDEKAEEDLDQGEETGD
jgi:hypothetical protein